MIEINKIFLDEEEITLEELNEAASAVNDGNKFYSYNVVELNRIENGNMYFTKTGYHIGKE